MCNTFWLIGIKKKKSENNLAEEMERKSWKIAKENKKEKFEKKNKITMIFLRQQLNQLVPRCDNRKNECESIN